jgi:hypothetical protein
VDFRGPGDKAAYQAVITNLAAYERLFRGVTNELAVGEASVPYLYMPNAPERIRHYIPRAKLIALLRHPVDRAYSAYLMRVASGHETLRDFAQAFRAGDERLRRQWGWAWHYAYVGFYHRHLTRYFTLFDRRQIRIYLHEDFHARPLAILQDIFRFLGVDDTVVPDTATRYNVGGVPRNRALQVFLTGPHPLKTLLKPFLPPRLRRSLLDVLVDWNLVKYKPPLAPEVRRELLAAYRDDIRKLQDLIERDLSAWLA